MDWFSEWFDSPYYHILYKNRDLSEAETFIDNLTNYLQLPSSANVIDIPCGKGRHCLYLNKKGYTVEGADLSPESIKYASSFKSDKLDFFVHDMRKEFATSKFDAVFNIFTSFGYFDDPQDNQSCVDAFAKALTPGGRLIMDFMNIAKVEKCLIASEQKQIDGIEFHLEKKIENNRIVKDIRFSDKGKNYHYQEKVSLLYQENFLDYFNKAGLKLLSTFGDYQLTPYDSNTSDRIIFIAQK